MKNFKEEKKLINYTTTTQEANKMLDGMMGLSIADAVGVPVEFKSRKILKLNPVTDMFGHGTHNMPIGTWSDDTSMSLATLDSINETKDINYDDIMNKFLEWRCNAKYTATGVFFDIGITTNNALKRYINGITPIKCGEIGINSNGNGSLMRILPITIYSYYNNLSDEEDTELINNISSLTHAHEISKLGCKIFSDFIKNLLKGNSKEESLVQISNKNYKKYYNIESIEYYKKILDRSIVELSEDEIKSTGFIVDTLEAAIWCTLNTKTYEGAVLKAVNLGDDTDTVGAVTGAMNGIIYGIENIPYKWKENLKNKELILNMCQKFNKKYIQNNVIEKGKTI